MQKTLATTLLASAVLSGCFHVDLDSGSSDETERALEESSIDSQAAALTSASVEISTDFTIGQAVADTAERISAFVHSQVPCADVKLSGATLTVHYGALPGNCSFRGHTFHGTHTIHVEKNEGTGVVVKHGWDEFNNGRISVSGEAIVTWNLQDPSRHIEHRLTWTRMSDGRTGEGSGDRIQRPLNGNLLEGIEVDGSRTWEGERGFWRLDIDHVQMRWTDPAPQSGALVLDTPYAKTLTFQFSRIDDNTIGVTADDGRRSVELEIARLGAISRPRQ